MEARDLSEIATGQGMSAATRASGKRTGLSSRDSGKGRVLLTPWFWVIQLLSDFWPLEL